MEECRKKRSQSSRVSTSSRATKGINRGSDEKLIACDGPHRGTYQAGKQKLPKLESDFRSCGRYKSTEEHRIAFESGQRSSKLPAGALMKSLLADEMSKERVCTRQAPSLIAKLMGLDGMPSQERVVEQPKRSVDGLHPKSVSVGSFRHRKSHGREQTQFKDVYEVRECSSVRNCDSEYHVSPHARLAADEVVIVMQNDMDARCNSTVKKLHGLKEFYGATGVSDSNNYCFRKFLQEPDSLFAKHLHNLQASQESHCERVRNLKASNMLDDNTNANGHLSDRKASKKIGLSMSHEYQGCIRHQVSQKHSKASDKCETVRSEANQIVYRVPTKIVLLKPNLEGSRKITKLSSSSSCELVYDGDRQENGGLRQAESQCKKRSPVALDISAHKSQESKELAKEITRQMRNKLGEISFNVPLSGHRAYSADESSHEVSGNDSTFESYAAFLTSQTSGRRSFHKKTPVSHYIESSVNKEGIKRLSERWKMSHRSEEFRVCTKGSTLGEMLSVSDNDVWLPSMGEEMTQGRSSCSSSRKSKLSGVAEPFGISSKDGWRDGCARTLSSINSLPTDNCDFGNPETYIRYEACGNGRFFTRKEGSMHGRKKGVNKNLSWQEGSSGGIIRLRGKKVNDAHGPQLKRKGTKSIAEVENPSVHESPIFRLDNVLTLDSETVREHVEVPRCAGSGDNLIPTSNISTSLQLHNYSGGIGFHETAQEPSMICHGAQRESPVNNNREAVQPSPVSVLDAPFIEDVSSGSECFERVSADLHGLRMQLRLLKLETGANSTASMLVSGDEEDESAGSSEEAKSAGFEGWETSYMADMLSEYEFDGKNPNIFTATGLSPECHVGPHIFEMLEKKYTRQVTNCSRSDRRLLFDRLNSYTLKIVERFTNPHPWVKPQFGTGTEPSWSNAWLEAELCKRLEVSVKEEKEDGDDIGMALLQGNVEWMNLGKCIDDIGCDIGNMLLDELISEILAM